MPEYKMVLYGNWLSGHTYKVRLCLELNSIPYQYEAVDLSVPRKKRPETFRQHARFDEVPVLVIDGQAFVQSNAILLHLAENLQIMPWGKHRKLGIEWLAWEQSGIGLSLANLRFAKKFKPETKTEVVAWLEDRLRSDLAVLNEHLKSGCRFMLSNEPSIADCSLVGYLYWLGDTGLKIGEWPHIESWLDRMSHLDNWQHPDQFQI